MTDLEKARQIINDVDHQMRELFLQRMQAAKTVAEYKKLHGIQVFDAQREAEVLARNTAAFTDVVPMSIPSRFMLLPFRR